MFSKILIANRGEIACRIIRTARRMGIATVAVHSDADDMARHVEEADEAVRIGPSPSSQSYLAIDRILDAVAKSGADAVHPGYGFLSENALFSDALEKAGVAFIGPGRRAIAAMGDKIESKKLARAAGVSTVPGSLGVVPDADAAVEIAREIGYPVMIKASAGGGGKGMRIARSDADAAEGFRAAQSEAKSSFADDRVFIEKFVQDPRHIEIQILADAHGNTIHLGERECSIQRRHQKVIEEAPSPFLDAETRAAMGAQAITLARAVDYRSAGTVEFIVDRDRNFYFLEMNTRLQVEHPVTEMVTGIDLVEQMIRIAAGEKLAIAQEDVRLDGWALEARIYAEDPFRSFLPSTGRLVRYRPPAESATVRVDSGVVEGGEISMFYDPMIAKLVTSGRDRDAAIAAMGQALDSYYIRGVSHNIPFLTAVMAHERFRAGRLTTGFIDEEFPDGFAESDLAPQDPARLIAVASVVHDRRERRAAGGSGRSQPREYVAVEAGSRIEHAVAVATQDRIERVRVGESTFVVDSDWRSGEALFHGVIDDETVCIQVDRLAVGYRAGHAGSQIEVAVMRPRVAALHRLMPVKVPPDLSQFLLSPMPGLLVRLSVEAGQDVKAGQELAVVEAMKMENILKATQDGTVKTLHAAAGDSLAVDQPIVEFE